MSDEEKIRKLFDRFDENKNGVIDKCELKTMFKTILSEMGETYPEKRNEQVVEEAMENFDVNKNGTIEFSEFLEVMNFLINEKGYELK